MSGSARCTTRFAAGAAETSSKTTEKCLRIGFTHEGVFRQDMVVKGKNRDTAWFSMLDREWPRLRSAFEAWLAASNFDGAGRQLRSLVELRAELS